MNITLRIADMKDWVLAGRAANIIYKRWAEAGRVHDVEFLMEVEFENEYVFNGRRTAKGNIIVERII